MPVTDPGPVGTCSAYAAHPVPTRFAPGPAIGVALGVAAMGDAGSVTADVVEPASVELSLEHDTAPNIATAPRPAATIALWTVLIAIPICLGWRGPPSCR
ncbi:hypothetical protein MMOR_41570 [Mycolicibacterium moriokaense]|uniref:Uncharacterized protein n=1 Tax=Mycolicibacterium moriokaense TaxID=39691 RepID=A0AAD1HE70_9MYCO|nr:hypothetical protein MMOR_41570 [Mycolicibacterium moriokaense]